MKRLFVMTKIDDKTRLLHMLDAAKEATGYVIERSIQDLTNDRLIALGLVKLIEIIGEAAANISTEYKTNHPQIPWSEIIGMRNRLVHAYFDINLEILWQIIQESLPLLIDELEKLPEIK